MRNRPSTGPLYAFKRGNIPGPNTGVFAFLPTYQLPMQSLQGAGLVQHRQAFSTQPIQQEFLHQLIVGSLEGITAGQISDQPLVTEDKQGVL